MTKADDVALKWAGTIKPNGRPAASFGGVPARDLTQAEVDALPDGLTVKHLVDSGLYKKPATGKKDGD